MPSPARTSPNPPPNPLVFSSSSRMMVGAIPRSFPTFLISWMCSWKKQQHKTREDSLTQGEAGARGQGLADGCTVGEEPGLDASGSEALALSVIKPRREGWPSNSAISCSSWLEFCRGAFERGSPLPALGLG